MKKLEERRVEQQVVDQRAHELLMIQMMQNMFQGHIIQPQSQPTAPPMSTKLPYPPAMTTQGTIQTTTTSISASQTENDELIASMEKTKLVHDSDDSMKRHKTDDNMDLLDHPPLTTTAISTPTEKIVDAESLFPLGVSNKGASQS